MATRRQGEAKRSDKRFHIFSDRRKAKTVLLASRPSIARSLSFSSTFHPLGAQNTLRTLQPKTKSAAPSASQREPRGRAFFPFLESKKTFQENLNLDLDLFQENKKWPLSPLASATSCSSPPDVRSALQFWGPGGLGLGIFGAPTERWATLRLDGKSDDGEDENEGHRLSSSSSSSSAAASPSDLSLPSHPPPPPFPLLAIKHAEGAAQATAGHSPFLAFEVRDLQASVEACLRAGGRLDGAIRHGVARGKGSVAAVVAPGGQMFSLFERGEG